MKGGQYTAGLIVLVTGVGEGIVASVVVGCAVAYVVVELVVVGIIVELVVELVVVLVDVVTVLVVEFEISYFEVVVKIFSVSFGPQKSGSSSELS